MTPVPANDRTYDPMSLLQKVPAARSLIEALADRMDETCVDDPAFAPLWKVFNAMTADAQAKVINQLHVLSLYPRRK